MTCTIRIENLTKAFKAHGGGTTTAVNDVSIQIEPGAQEPGTEPACADACEPGAAPA